MPGSDRGNAKRFDGERALVTGGAGGIVNIGLLEGLGKNPHHPAYGVSKAGSHGLTRTVVEEERLHGARCNAVAPAWMDAALKDDFMAEMSEPAAFRAGFGQIHPLCRTGRPDEGSRRVCRLVSGEAVFVPVQVFAIDGGRTAQLSLP